MKSTILFVWCLVLAFVQVVIIGTGKEELKSVAQ